MPHVKIDTVISVDIPDVDYLWIAERSETSPSGSVSFSASAIRRYRKLTQQDDVPAWKIRHQMQNEFKGFV